MPKVCFAKDVWLEMIQSPAYKEGHKEHYKIEGKFGEVKQGHGVGRCRYLGLLKFGIQMFFTAKVLSLKEIVKWLPGVGLKTNRVLGSKLKEICRWK